MIIAYDGTVVHEMLIFIIIIFLRSILKSFYQHLKNQTEQQVQLVRPLIKPFSIWLTYYMLNQLLEIYQLS